MINNVYAAAVRYAALGWSVIPLKPNSKEPLIPWLEFQTRRPSKDELMKWFLGTQNNIGIVTGTVSRICVLDVDTTVLSKSVSTASSPITVLTKRGRHLYFQYGGETNSASRIAEHVDVRGEGGFVVGPGSVVGGHRYRFVNSVIRPDLLSPFPRELLDGVSQPSTDGNGGRNAKQEDWLSEALEGLREGNRNATFTSIVGRLHRDRHTSSSILTLLRPHAEQHSFPLGELENVIQSVTKYQNGNGQSQGGEIYSGGDKAEDIEEFLKGEEKVEWIVESLISKNGIGFIAGLPESLKTWITIDLAIEAARGGTWMGMKVSRTKTLFVDQERFIGETRRRFKKIMKGKGVKSGDVKDYLTIQVGSTTRLNLDDSFTAFRRKLQDIRPGLLIVDSFATFSTVAENDRQEVQKVLERVKQIRQEFGCTVLLIDHENKGVLNPDMQGDMPNMFSIVGSVGKPAAAELVLTVRRDKGDTATMYNTKNSLAPSIPPISIRIIDTEDGGVKLVYG